LNYGLKDSGKREEFETGSRRDTREGKGRFDLISPYAERRLALVLEKGAIKYGERNWEKGQPLGRYLDSALRHVNCVKMGMHDEDHAAQAMWNMHSFMHTAELIEQGKLPRSLDDIGYVLLSSESDVAEQPARPEQSEECQVSSITCYLPPDGWHCTRIAGHEGPCACVRDIEPEASGAYPATSEAEDDYPLWQRIQSYLHAHGPQLGCKMWDMMGDWGEDSYPKIALAREIASVRRVRWNGHLYWCLPGQWPWDKTWEELST